MTGNNVYMVIIRGRPNFPNTMTEEEEKIMGEHFEYLKGLMAQGKLIMAGPTLDDSGGYIILNTNSEDKNNTSISLMYSKDQHFLAAINGT